MATRRNSVGDGYVKFSDETVNFEDTYQGNQGINDGLSDEIPNEIGSRSSLHHNISFNNGVEGTNLPTFSSNIIEKHWSMNYHEAAIFLEEGQNNEKFDSHPREPEALPAYLLVHNRWYYSLDLFASLGLMMLAFGEDPAVPKFALPVAVHCLIELVTLSIIGIELGMKLRWMGWLTILKHKRTLVKSLTLIIMFLEAIVILIRQSSHFRVTRALRPIFLVDTRPLGGVRRSIRQILQSLPPILDMLALIFFFVTIYSLLGYYLFHDQPNNAYFDSLYDSFVSMFVLLTTANFPDVMMPAYAKSKWYSVFFISYLCVVLYILMNLMLAVVYETYTSIERQKFKKLLLHKRQACNHAFRLLVTKNNPNQIMFKQFEGLMSYFASDKSPRDVVLVYALLKNGKPGGLTLNEFYNLYDAITLQWEPQYSNIPWFHAAWMPLQNICQLAHNTISWKYFDYMLYCLILLNGVFMVIRAATPYNTIEESARAFYASWDSIMFLGIFAFEAVLKILGLGVSQYFSSGWNTYDFIVTLSGLVGVVFLTIFPSLTFIVVLRPLKLLHLYKMKKRYRDILGTLALLTPLMCSTVVVMIVLYYFFAIIGMELFAGYDLRNCCKGSSVEDFYRFSGNESSALGYYYLNNFDNFIVSSVTLFELSVVNNWFILMNGYAIVVHPASRIYFILFYLFTMIVLTIVVASVLEAFRFRIQYKRQTSKKDEEKMLHEEVDVKWDDLQTWIRDVHILNKIRSSFVVGGSSIFIGCRPRTREVLQRRMYRAEISEWMVEAAKDDLPIT